ncbi:MAG: YidC/Oxa1 family membrane protein insertase [Clostridia bacterium]
MISFFANLFGYVLNFLYGFVGNYGWAIILFSVIVKIIMLPISINQQKTMKKSQKINDEMKQIQFKYKNDPEKLNQEVMALYKREKLSPFSGCFSAIVQIILLFAVFYLVRSPLTYMKKVDSEVINKMEAVVQEQGNASNYKEIAVINYMNKLEGESTVSVSEEEKNGENQESENSENENTQNNENTQSQEQTNSEENTETEEKDTFNINDYKDQAYINMEFLGLDLSKVPTEDLGDLKVLIIPALYVISSFISIKLSTSTTNKKKKDEKLIGDGKETKVEEEYDAMEQANKSMSWFMPLMSISIACIAPLGLALYWLVNNILMIFERLFLNKFFKDEKEEAKKENA